MTSNRQREVAKLLCIVVLKYSVVLSTFTIVAFCILALFYRQKMAILDYVIEIGPLWFLAILCSSYYLSFCRLHRLLLLYTFAANMMFNQYIWMGIRHTAPVLYFFIITGIALLYQVLEKIIRKTSRNKDIIEPGDSLRCYP